MGWGTAFQCEIVINKEHYQSLYEVEDRIKDLEDFNSKLESEILMYASANPKDIVPKDWEDQAINFIKTEINAALEILKENNDLLFKLYLLKENFDKKEQW